MNRDELLDRAVGKCVPVHTGTWGVCDTHNVGWGPAAFEQGRCWKVAGEVKAVEIALFFVGAEVEALGHTNICSMQLHNPKNRQCTCFQKDVLPLIDGGTP